MLDLTSFLKKRIQMAVKMLGILNYPSGLSLVYLLGNLTRWNSFCSGDSKLVCLVIADRS